MRKLAFLLITVAGVVVVTASCTVVTSESRLPTENQQSAPAPQPRNPGQLEQVVPGAQLEASQELGPNTQELLQDMNTAVQVVNSYWATHWSDFFTGTYTPPTVAGLYDGSTTGGPTCGGAPPVPDNAFYCATGEDFLAWDANLMAKGFQFGDSWVYLVIAHEWAHAIQYRLSEDLQSQSAELQADCLAGAVLYGASRDGTLKFEQGDEKEIATGLAELGDETPWTQEGDHGDAFERIQSFSIGRTGGVQACLPIS